MKHILTIIGARPQIIKASAISRAMRLHSAVLKESILHTGQHYDPQMSSNLMEELGMASPDIQLSVGSASHGVQTAHMIEGIEEAIIKLRPDAVLLYGDTNSTLSGAVAASKLGVSVIHIEAGMRAFEKQMPEEINRILSDQVSSYLFSPTQTGLNNLAREGFPIDKVGPFGINNPCVKNVGDVMYDNALYFAEAGKAAFRALLPESEVADGFVLITLHRPFNVDEPEKLRSLLLAIHEELKKLNLKAIFPVHPRTQKIMTGFNVATQLPLISFIGPMGYLQMLGAEQLSSAVVTDSGGVQKEAYFFGKPCAVVRPQTEWVEILENSSSVLMPDAEAIRLSLVDLLTRKNLKFDQIFGRGNAAELICELLCNHL